MLAVKAHIANKVGIPVSDLANLNGIMISANLNPGDYIIIPKMESENLYFDKYVIRKGDTIYSIARSFNVSPSYLLRLNGLNDADVIYPGESIFVPKQGTSFYITTNDDTLNDVVRSLGASANDIASQNSTIYLTNDQLIVYKK